MRSRCPPRPGPATPKAGSRPRRPATRPRHDRTGNRAAGAVCLHPQRRPQHRRRRPAQRPPAPGVRADSAGTDPTDALNPTVVAALAERGISLAGVAPKPITTELLADADLVITMSRHATGPTLPPGAARQQHWQLGFPGDDLEAMRGFCDQVDGRVYTLLADLSPPSSRP